VLTVRGYREARRRISSGRRGLPSDKGIVKRFGSWPRLREQMGYRDSEFQLMFGTTNTRWTRETVIIALVRMRKELRGKPLRADDLLPHRRPITGGPYPSRDTVYVRFGSWSAVSEALAA